MMRTRPDTLLGVDWGTSNRRAYLVARDGSLLAERHDDQGLLKVQGAFADSLQALRSVIGAAPGVPAVLSGMVGSAGGWQQVPYLDGAVALTDLGRHLVPVRDAPHNRIVPGYCIRTGGIDVMRGEETQLLGAVAGGLADGWVILPGTHSKWALLQGGRVARLITFMTGELFAMLAAGGTLAPLMAQGGDDAHAFADGLREARHEGALSHALFGVRARVMAQAMPASQARSFVSGLLIGAEFASAPPAATVHIIGAPALAARYASAAASAGLRVRILDAQGIYLAALTSLLEHTT